MLEELLREKRANIYNGIHQIKIENQFTKIFSISITPSPENFLNLSFGKLNEVTLPLHPVLTISLIQKGGGTWPCDALATNSV